MFGYLHRESFTDNTLSNADKDMIHKNKCYSANASMVLRVIPMGECGMGTRVGFN
jgi:hypothetical protein